MRHFIEGEGDVAGPGMGDLRHWCCSGDRNIPLTDDIEETIVIEGGMDVSGALHHHAATIVIRSDLLALPLARHDIGARLRIGIQYRDLFLHVAIVARAPGAEEIAGPGPMTGDPLALD